MSNDFRDISQPSPQPTVLTVPQALQGQRFPPQQQLLLYSPAQWEQFIEEWAYFCLKNILYNQVQHYTGSGDMGIDIAGFADANQLLGVWDNYQCKHYNHALHPSDAWPEIGKILWYSFNNEYIAPRQYFFVAPREVGISLARLLAHRDKLKKTLIAQWDKDVRDKITTSQAIPLEGKLLDYVLAFDFSIFKAKSVLEIIEDHQKCPFHAARFGGGLPNRPPVQNPPADIEPHESRYVEQLLMAYADHKKTDISSVKDLKNWKKLNDHFGRQREAFYHAESLRVFARDSVPYGTFESLQDDIYDGVIDIHDADHADGFMRVCGVTKAARELNLTSNALLTCAKMKDRDGICHQLANEDKLQWTKSEEQAEAECQ